MDYEQVGVQLVVLQNGIERIKNDVHLSEMGKQRASKNLQAEIDAFRDVAHSVLSSEWKYIGKRHSELQARREEAEREESTRWNYPMLEHERKTIEPKLRSSRDATELRGVYNELSASGVPERKRALYELVPEYAERHGSASLAKQANEALRELTTTEEMKRLEMDGKALIERAQNVKRSTLRASQFYSNGGANLREEEWFLEVMRGINIRERLDIERSVIQATLEVT